MGSLIADTTERLRRRYLHGPSDCRAGCGVCAGALLATAARFARPRRAVIGAVGALAVLASMLLLPLGQQIAPWRQQAVQLASELATVGPDDRSTASALGHDLHLLGYVPPPDDEVTSSDTQDGENEEQDTAGEDRADADVNGTDSERPSATRATPPRDDAAEETSTRQTPSSQRSAQDGDESSVAPDPRPIPAITVQGDQILRGGEPWWFLGYNSFVWSGDCGNDDEKMTVADVEQWFSEMRHDGHGAVRLFFYDGWDIDRLDAAVESAKRHNVYLTITLDDAIGGCGENDKDAGWFADQAERDVYQAHMEMLLERYRGETTFAWFEFFNEPSYEDGALREFFDEMGKAADAVDPDRLFSSGTVAPYWLDGEENFAEVHESPGVDIASMHEYDEGEVESNHGAGVRANSAGKPVIVGEYGITAGEGCGSGFDSRADRIADKAEAYTSIDGYVGAFAWAWQPGGGGCELGNLDADTATQDVLREFAAEPADLEESAGNERDAGLDITDQATADERWEDVAQELADALAGIDDPDARELAQVLAEAGFGAEQGDPAGPGDSASPTDDNHAETDVATSMPRRPA
jgi:hypothetical protein